MQRVELNIISGESVVFNLTDEEIASLPPPPTNAEKLSLELKELSDVYQSDLTQYRLLWTSISITDGVNEETRKTNLRTQWSARTAQYSTDVAATKLKFQ